MKNKNFFFLVIVVIVCVLSQLAFAAQLTCEAKVTCDGVATASADESDTLSLYYLQAPVFEFLFGDKLGKLDLFHTAIGVHNHNTNQNFTIEFDAVYEVPNSTFPYFTEDSNGNEDLLWCNAGSVCIIPSVNWTYFEPRVELIATVDGKTFNELMDYIVNKVGPNNPYYYLWSVWNEWQKDSFWKSNACYDFVWDVFGWLSIDAGQTLPAEMKHDFLNLYISQAPQPVDYYGNEQVRAEVLAFWHRIDMWEPGLTKEQYLEKFLDFLVSDKYLVHGSQYYFLESHFPYFGYFYETENFTQPIASSEAPLSSSSSLSASVSVPVEESKLSTSSIIRFAVTKLQEMNVLQLSPSNPLRKDAIKSVAAIVMTMFEEAKKLEQELL